MLRQSRDRHWSGECLWPQERGDSRLVREAVWRLGLDFNPFGPEKAEQDPLLPDLFYRDPEIWGELIAPQPSVVIAPPGCGRSALIWMLRHEANLIGSELARVFPVYVPLQTLASRRELRQTLQAALSAELCDSLASEPPGLSGEQAGDGRTHTYFLIDVCVNQKGSIDALLEALFERWLAAWLPHHVAPKVFLDVEPISCPVTPLRLDWDADALHQLLWHRLERAGLVLQVDQPGLSGWVQGVKDPDGVLVERAGNCPARLIRLGNRLIRRLAQPQMLTCQEFFDLTEEGATPPHLI